MRGSIGIPNSCVNVMFCVAGFRPGSRGLAWRVPKGAPFVVEQKDQTTVALSEMHHAK